MRGRLASAFIGGAIANRRAKYMYQQQGNDQLQEYKFQQQQEELERLRAQQQQQQQQAMYSQPQQPQLQGSSSNQADIANQLHKFAELHEKGALTDAEFQQLKSKLLMQM
jgi:hypothetical protein